MVLGFYICIKSSKSFHKGGFHVFKWNYCYKTRADTHQLSSPGLKLFLLRFERLLDIQGHKFYQASIYLTLSFPIG